MKERLDGKKIKNQDVKCKNIWGKEKARVGITTTPNKDNLGRGRQEL
jgi:hypothetical protein